MPSRFTKLFSALILCGLIVTLVDASTDAQEPIPLIPPMPPRAEVRNAQPDADPNALPEGVEVLAKGPVHEGFATTTEAPVPSEVIAKQPPESIEELPPDQKPEGDNVQWIPGYWDWAEDSEQFIWVSGFWRQPPPGRMWVPGSWREVQGGWQWVSGFWQEAAPAQGEQPAQPEIIYQPEPPVTLETGPTVPAPSETHVYSPGSWVWRGKYVWRPGIWIQYRPNWVWVPAHYCWTPMGFVFIDGYWDYTLVDRGILFAPVIVPQAVYTRRGFIYTPLFVVSEQAMFGAMFVRRGYGNYYFGDYFANQYATGGYRPWAGRVNNGAFAIGYGTGRTWGYDPLWSHYAVTHRADRVWNTRVNDLYVGRYTGKVARPPVNLTQQNVTINKITNTNVTNVTNNITVANKTVTVNKQNVTDVAMVAPVRFAKNFQPDANIKTVTNEVRQAEAVTAKQVREVSKQRAKLEAPPANTPAVKPTEPKAVKIEVPKNLVTRSQVKDEKKAPPPAPIKAEPKPTPKVDPKAVDPNPKDPSPKPKVDPKPKEPEPKPKVDPKPKEPEPKPKVDPKPKEPEPKPKVDPKPKEPEPKPKEPAPKPKVDPKPKEPEPKPKVDPKPKEPEPKPKVDPLPKPKVEPLPPPKPKVEPPPPPKVDPPKPKVESPPPPKVEPPKPKVEPPVPKKVEPPPTPKVEPKKKEEPKKKDDKKDDKKDS